MGYVSCTADYTDSFGNVGDYYLYECLEEDVAQLCANAVIEFSYSAFQYGTCNNCMRYVANGMAVCDPRFGSCPC